MYSKNTLKKPSKLWWFFAVFLLVLFMLVQLPAAWIVKKFAPNQNVIENINGNIYRGQAQWRLPNQLSQSQVPITGNFSWQWRVWEILWLKAGADVTVSSGNSSIEGKLGLTSNTWNIKDMSGKLTADFLKKVLPMQWSDTDINLQKIHLKNIYKGEKKDWLVADGNLTWAGGEIGYNNQGKLYTSNLPPMRANLSLEENKLHVNLLNTKDERMGDIYLDADSMVDVQLTQRLLLNVKGYKGNAAPDTAVVSVRQPLSTLGK